MILINNDTNLSLRIFQKSINDKIQILFIINDKIQIVFISGGDLCPLMIKTKIV